MSFFYPTGKIGSKDIITLIKKLVTPCYDWPQFRHYIGSDTDVRFRVKLGPSEVNHCSTRADVSDGTKELSENHKFLDKKHGNCSVVRGALKYSAPV